MKELEMSILLNTIDNMASAADDKGEKDFGLRLSVKDAFGLCKYIYQIEAERDAAVADLKDAMPCKACKYLAVLEHCKNCYPENHWEWRGLSLESKTSDKEEKHE